MSKTARKILLFVGILIVVVGALFLADALIGRRPGGGPEPSPSEPSLSSSPSPSDTAPPVSPTPSEEPSPEPSEDGSVLREETPEGVRYTFTAPVAYALTVDESVYRYDGESGRFLADDPAEFIQLNFVEGKDALGLAPSFLDGLIRYTEFEQSGESYIPGTDIIGQTLTGKNEQAQVQAWLVNTDQGALTVAVGSAVGDTEAAGRLERALATLTIAR